MNRGPISTSRPAWSRGTSTPAPTSACNCPASTWSSTSGAGSRSTWASRRSSTATGSTTSWPVTECPSSVDGSTRNGSTASCSPAGPAESNAAQGPVDGARNEPSARSAGERDGLAAQDNAQRSVEAASPHRVLEVAQRRSEHAVVVVVHRDGQRRSDQFHHVGALLRVQGDQNAGDAGAAQVDHHGVDVRIAFVDRTQVVPAQRVAGQVDAKLHAATAIQFEDA